MSGTIMKSKKEWLEEALERGINVLIYQGKKTISLVESGNTAPNYERLCANTEVHTHL